MSVSGLYTNTNPFSETPPGALSVANDIIIARNGVAETRPGFAKYGTVLSGMQSLHSFRGSPVQFDGSTMSYDSGSGTWVAYSGSFTKPTYNNIKSFEANDSLFFTTLTGVYKTPALTTSPSLAGVPRALDGQASTTGASGFLANGYQVAYRMIWQLTDTNGVILQSSPSARFLVSNSSGGTRNSSITFTIPTGITTSHYYRIYRSNQFTVTPDDEMYLCMQGQPSAGDITTGNMTVTDTIVDSLRDEALYTNPSQQGLDQQNEFPPQCNDALFYKQVAVYANCKNRHNTTIRLIGTSGSLLVIDDTITIDGVIYTAKGTETISSGQFKVFTTGTMPDDVNNTIESLVRVINRYASNTSVYAYNLSTPSSPGTIYLEKRVFNANSFTVISSRGAAFSPALPSAGSTYVSSENIALNRIYISKVYYPESVPLNNFFDIGAADKPINRIEITGDYIWIFKDDGVYRMSGNTYNDMSPSVYDMTLKLIGNDNICRLYGDIYAYTNKGICRLNQSNANDRVSQPINDIILNLLYYTNFSNSFFIGYEQLKTLIFFTVQNNNDTVPTIAYCYNYFTNAWFVWNLTKKCGIVIGNHLYLGDYSNNYVYQDNKTGMLSDYSDDSYSVTISSSSGYTVILASTANLQAGNQLSQSGTTSIIRSIDSLTQITVYDVKTWTAGAATVYKQYNSEIQWIQQPIGQPGKLKQFREASFIFTRSDFDQIKLGFSSTFNPDVTYSTISYSSTVSWGNFAWGQVGWGNSFFKPQPIRIYVNNEDQRTMWVYPKVRLEKPNQRFSISGVSMCYNEMSARFS